MLTGNSSFISSVNRERVSGSLRWDSRCVVAMVGGLKLRWKLPKNHPGSTRAATMAPPACPNCGRIFRDSSAVLKHMNHCYTSCHRWFAKSPPPSQHPLGTNSTLTSIDFPGAGHVFGFGAGFMGRFSNDEDTEARSVNSYHPFLSKDEWEIAEFLSCSGLSMSLIDKFLSLNSVSYFNCSGGARPLIILDCRTRPVF